MREVDWLYGPALLVRREAADAVGLFDEDFFMFSEEVDWLTRFRRAGWKVLFYPGRRGRARRRRLARRAAVRREPARAAALPREAQGPKEAERARRLLLWSLRLRALVLAARASTATGVRFLSSGNAGASRVTR